jgi:hypothetical protein
MSYGFVTPDSFPFNHPTVKLPMDSITQEQTLIAYAYMFPEKREDSSII